MAAALQTVSTHHADLRDLFTEDLLIACFKVYSLVLMAVIPSACVDVYGAYLVGGRRATHRFSYELLCMLGAIIVANRSRHIPG